ncbi:TIGR00341 family protein [Sinomicrobium soli]|uniref:TIGR00341 family protein n=1 Tax=Sinomicrobium sp. N-1-3-6 TaxID=2219864 RepID=UPI000DCC7E15|nr:TIGR00341 family protein [Sinomicrobium sp. N-1-3-6]RAV27497.1 TIGR00341 family protein [Sinomicrobium sp. N-1-3-6]
MRRLEIILEKDKQERVSALLEGSEVVEKWEVKTIEGYVILNVLLQDEYSTTLLQELEKEAYHRVIIHPVEGTLPKVDLPDTEEKDKISFGKFITISKEELYSDVDEPVSLSVNFLLMIILSSFVAGIGILKDNVAIIIGAMVIAPFLGPNMSMAFGTTLGDWHIIRKSMLTGIVSTLITLAISFFWGMFASGVGDITMDPDLGMQDIVLALVCGFAGVISVLGGQGGSLVGVMVAAALVPPLVRAGLLFGGGYYTDALNSFLIFSTNIICLNIAGIITFYLAGIRPGKWWEKEKAKRKTRNAFLIWSFGLVLIIVAILVIRKLGGEQ